MTTKSDKEIAFAIQTARKALNNAIADGHANGLNIEIEVQEFQTPSTGNGPRPRVEIIIMRPIE